MCTINRPREVGRFLDSLAAQTYRDFEMIVVDQSGDDRYVSILQPFFEKFELKHLRCAPGASRARNVGWRAMTGDILGYPDDDCVYEPDLLERIAKLLEERKSDGGVITRVAGSDYWDLRPGPVTRKRIWWQGLDFTLFLRREVIDRTGGMNEQLGPGSGTPWGSCEAIDLELRAMEKGATLWYEPSITVAHPGPIDRDTSLHLDLKKAKAYAMGKGHVLRIHHYPLWFTAYMISRPAVGAVFSLLRFRGAMARMYMTYALGMLSGYVSIV